MAAIRQWYTSNLRVVGANVVYEAILLNVFQGLNLKGNEIASFYHRHFNLHYN